MKPSVLFALLLFAGCAHETPVQMIDGVQITDGERTACSALGCAVFTEGELRNIAKRYFDAGYLHGWTDAHTQAGRGI